MLRHVFSLSLVLIALLVTSSVHAADDEAVDIGYYALKPSIVSNVTGGPKYIRCDIQLMTKQKSEISSIGLHSPALRHTILMLIAGRDGKQLATRDGKEALRKAALTAIQDQLKTLTGRPIVKDLYFTAYYVK